MGNLGTVAIASGVVIFVSEIVDYANTSKANTGRYGKEALGFGVYVTGIAFIGEFAQDLAYRIAVLVLVTILLLRIPAVLSNVNNTLKSPAQSSNKSGSAFGPGGGSVGGGGGGSSNGGSSW